MRRMLPRTSTARRVGLILVIITVVVLAAFVIVFAVHRVTPIPDAKPVVDIGGERNIPTFWNTILLLSVAVAAVVALRRSNRDGRRELSWLVVAAAAVYLSFDEAFELHERLRNPFGSITDDLPTYAWVIPGAALAVAGSAVLITAGRRLPPIARPRLAAALGLYGVSAVGVEAVNGWFREHDRDAAYTIGTVLEESGEMGACILAVTAILDAICTMSTADSNRAPFTSAPAPSSATPRAQIVRKEASEA
jgi:hypothetical protein